MNPRVFISQICLSWFLIFTTMTSLYGMKEETTQQVPRSYTMQDLEFVDLIFKKIVEMVVTLKTVSVWDDESQESKETLDLSGFPEDIRIFFPPPGKTPSMQLNNYLARFLKYCPQSPWCYLVALVYITRLVERYGSKIFNQLTCHRIFLVAFVVAVKCFDDKYYTNNFYAKVGGIPLVNLNNLEPKFLEIINYNIFVSKKEFDKFCFEAPEIKFFVLWLNIKIDDFVRDLNDELDDLLSEFKKLKIVDQV